MSLFATPRTVYSTWNSPGKNIKPRLRKVQLIPSADGFHPASEFSWCCAPHFHPWFLPKNPDLLDQATLCCSRSPARVWTLADHPGGRHARSPCTAHLLNFQVESASWIPQGSLEQPAWDFHCWATLPTADPGQTSSGSLTNPEPSPPTWAPKESQVKTVPSPGLPW